MVFEQSATWLSWHSQIEASQGGIPGIGVLIRVYWILISVSDFLDEKTSQPMGCKCFVLRNTEGKVMPPVRKAHWQINVEGRKQGELCLERKIVSREKKFAVQKSLRSSGRW